MASFHIVPYRATSLRDMEWALPRRPARCSASLRVRTRERARLRVTVRRAGKGSWWRAGPPATWRTGGCPAAAAPGGAGTGPEGPAPAGTR